jgi:RHS repeat-associated protein
LHQAGSTTLDGASYTYDYAGNRTSKTNDLNGTTWNYGYDPIYELLQVTHDGSTKESYSYDAVGNRLSSSAVPTYSYNTSNELTSNSSGSYTYDANGNTLSDPSGKSYSWDFENRLVQAVVPGTGTVAFKYDPFGRRIYKSSPNFTGIFVYDRDSLIETVNSSGTEISSYTQTQNLDEPLAELRSGTASYYQQDGLGSVTSLSSSTGAVATTYTYDSFGKLTASTGTLINPFRYTGREFDLETGIYEYRARYFDPSVGRFMSEDPIQFKGGVNFYTYVKNNPVLRIDPSGLIHQAWNEPPFDGRLHDDPGAGLEILCTKGRNISQDIAWLEHSIIVRSAELAALGKDADAGHIDRAASEIATLERCQEDCEKNRKPDPLPEEIPFWEQIFNPRNLKVLLSSAP